MKLLSLALGGLDFGKEGKRSRREIFGWLRGAFGRSRREVGSRLKGPAKSGCAFMCDMCDRDAATYLNV